MTRVVLVHGFTQTHRSWDAVVNALAPEHDVVALDMPGHGALSDVALDLWQGARLVAQQPLWNRLAELEMPVLLVAGERDQRFSEIAREMALATGSNARVALVADAGHAAHLERPDPFVEIVKTFLDQH